MPNYNIDKDLEGALPSPGRAKLKELLDVNLVTNESKATMLTGLAPLDSPAFTTTATLDGNELATQLYVQSNVAGVITRTAALGHPLIPNEITITGITSPDIEEGLVLIPNGMQEERPMWRLLDPPGLSGGSANVWWDVGYWEVVIINSLNGLVYYSQSESEALTPFGLTFLEPSTYGTGVSVVTGDTVSPAAIGQRCIVGDEGDGDDIGNGNYLEFTSYDGETWELSGPAGVVEDEDNPGTYKKVEFSDGQSLYTAYSILAPVA